MCDKVWLFISDTTVSCLRSIRGQRNVSNENQDGIIYCPECCPCAFWPTPIQTLGTECATCCNFCFAVFVVFLYNYINYIIVYCMWNIIGMEKSS